MDLRRFALSVCLAMLACGLVRTPHAEGAPAFARKYRVSCTTCYAPPPRLKAFGEEFAGGGFRMEEGQEPTRAYADVGDPLLLLPRDLHIGIRMEGFASWKEDARAETDAEFPWVWKILSGGPISDKASYYFYFLIERGEVVGLEDAYLQWNGLFGLPVDVMAGQFQVCDPLFKRELRLERSDYLIYKARVGHSSVDLTYNRGLMFGWTFPGEIETFLEVVAGNGISHADESQDFDKDKYKNVALRLTRSIGPIRIGGFGYYGKEKGDSSGVNVMKYWGYDFTVALGNRVEVNGQYLERRDDNPMFLDKPADEYETMGGLVEVHVFPQGQDGRWVLTGLYNYVDSHDDSAKAETVSLTINRLLARNLRLLMEFGRDIEYEASRGTLGLLAAF